MDLLLCLNEQLDLFHLGVNVYSVNLYGVNNYPTRVRYWVSLVRAHILASLGKPFDETGFTDLSQKKWAYDFDKARRVAPSRRPAPRRPAPAPPRPRADRRVRPWRGRRVSSSSATTSLAGL